MISVKDKIRESVNKKAIDYTLLVLFNSPAYLEWLRYDGGRKPPVVFVVSTIYYEIFFNETSYENFLNEIS